MIYSSLPIIKDGIMMLLDAALPQEDIKKITDIIEAQKETSDYHHLQTRESGSHVFISVHIVFNVTISLYDAHLVSDKLEMKIKKLFEDKKVHVLIHMDPYDDSEINEAEDTY
jgi:divalent metal cation (Fe/Co/Zn/Cd) transporter